MPVDNPRDTPAVAPNRGPITPPAGKPVPVLHQYGINGVADLNDRVQAVVAAHVHATGVKPSPALVYDVVRSPIGRDQYADLFRFPSLGKAKTAQIVGVNPPIDLNGEMVAAIKANQFDAWSYENKDRIKEAFADPAERQKLVMAASNAGLFKPAQLLAQSFLVNPNSTVNRAIRYTGEQLSQVATGLALGPPTLAFAEGRGVVNSVREKSLAPLAKENAKLARGVAKGAKQDVTNPKENVGNLVLDAFGLVSLGAGGYTRAVRANEHVLEEGGVLTGVKTAARRPVGGTAELTKSGFTENQLLTENPVLRPLQRLLVGERNARMARRASVDPGGAISINLGERVQNVVDLALDPIRGNFSSENKLGREARVRRRIELQVQMGLKRDLDRVAGWAQTASKAYQRIAQRGIHPKSLTVGEQKAIDVLALDDPTPLETWQKFHQNMLDLGIGDPVAHRAQLSALKLAGKALADPSPRLQRALELTREVVAEQERIKAEQLGLQVETANRRVIGEGEFVRRSGQAASRDEAAAIPAPGILGVVDETRSPGAIVTDITKVKTRLASKTLKPAVRNQNQKRLATLQQELVDARKATAQQRQSPTSHYVPRQRKGKPRRGVSENIELFSPQSGKFGVPEPKLPASLTHEYGGKSIQAGDFRIDATALASEEYARVVRAASKLNEWMKLRESGIDQPPDLRWYRPVRKGTAVDDGLRDIVDRTLDAELSTEDALFLGKQADALERYLYPAELKNGQWHLLPDVSPDDVVWQDIRLLDRYRPPAPHGMKTFFQVANEPFRDIALLYRLAYALNAVGNVAMLTVDRGPFWIPDLFRSIHSGKLYGEKTARAIETLSGTSRSQSYSPIGVGEGIAHTLTAPGRVAARAWNVITDQKFREAAIIGQLRRQARELGLDPDAPDTFEKLLFDRQYEKQRNEGVRRGNKSMVEMDNMTWFEREYLRHFVFVYPWQSRSFVWTLRTLIEHPVEAAVLNQIGREADEEMPDVLKRVPEWFKRIGYIPVGFNSDGSPKVVNPSSVNTFATLNQLLYPLAAGFGNVKYASAADLLGPAATFAVHGVTGKDEFGNDYPGSDWMGAAREVLLQLPQLRPATRKASEALPAADLSDRETLVKRLNAALHQTVFTPGWLDGYGSLLSGGLTPRDTNPLALEARFYRDATPAQRQKIEMGLIHKALGMQADLLQEKLPGDVRDGVDVAGDIAYAEKIQTKQIGRPLTDKERMVAAIDVLKQKARINDADAALLEKKLGKITDPADLARFQSGLMDKYASAKVLRQWDSDVRFVWSFRPEVLKPKLASLKTQGLVSSAKLPTDQETLFVWGRQALAYRREARNWSQRLQAAQGSDDAALLDAQYKAWIDRQDAPVHVDGTTLPSPVRMTWANEQPEAQQQHLAGVVKAGWSGLTNFDKDLVGRKVSASTSQAWLEVAQAVHDYKQQNPGSSIQRDQLDALAKQIDRDPRYRGFLKDYQYSRQPLIDRFEQTSVYREMPDRPTFDRIVGTDASKAAKAVLSGNYDNGQLRALWGKYVESDVQPAIEKDKTLATFLAPYGITFLKGLISR